MKCICDNCGRSFGKAPSEIEKNTNNFCCEKCYKEWRKIHWRK